MRIGRLRMNSGPERSLGWRWGDKHKVHHLNNSKNIYKFPQKAKVLNKTADIYDVW